MLYSFFMPPGKMKERLTNPYVEFFSIISFDLHFFIDCILQRCTLKLGCCFPSSAGRVYLGLKSTMKKYPCRVPVLLDLDVASPQSRSIIGSLVSSVSLKLHFYLLSSGNKSVARTYFVLVAYFS